MTKLRGFDAFTGRRVGRVNTITKLEQDARDAWREESSQLPSMLPSWFEPSASDFLPSEIADQLPKLFARNEG
jgi:hypothetical protein